MPIYNQPVLTANGTSGKLATASYASSEIGNARAAWKAFDGVVSTNPEANIWHSAQGSPQSITFYSPEQINVSQVKLINSPGHYGITNGILQGSNDGSTFTDIQSFTNSTTAYSATWYINAPNNNKFYRYHRIYCSATAASGPYYVINEIYFTAATRQRSPKFFRRERVPGTITGKNGEVLQLCSWLGSSGTQYIDLGFKVSSAMTITTKITALESTGNAFIGAYTSDSNDYRLFNASNEIYFDMAAARINGSTWNSGETYTFELGNYYVKRNGSTILTGSAQSWTSTPNLWLFGSGGNEWKQNCRFWSFTAVQGGVTFMDLLPVIRKGVPCMYDQITGKFFYNGGTGDFDYRLIGDEFTINQKPKFYRLSKIAGNVNGMQ